jgi:3',5'-cyclic AMP phosphodiesterase CpdA
MNRQSLFSALSLFLLLFTAMSFGQMPDLAPLPQTGSLSKPADASKFTFVLAGDNRPAHSTCPQPPTPGQIFSAVHDMKPAASFVLWTGDTISGKDPNEAILKAQYAGFLNIAVTAGVPVFNAPGNHEMDDANEVPSKAMKDFYKKYMAGTYGAFSYGNSRFIALDSENEPTPVKLTKQKSTAEGTVKSQPPGFITKEQLHLLKGDLEANKDKAHVIIFMHHPVKPYSSKTGLYEPSVKALKDIFKNYKNVSYVVSGHEHIYYNPQGPKDKLTDPPSRKDPSQPPYYLISGGGGAPLKQGTPGSFFHYLIFKVDGDTITPTLVKVTSSSNCPAK